MYCRVKRLSDQQVRSQLSRFNQQGRSQLSWFNQQGRSHLSWLPWSGFHCVYCSVFHFIIVTTEETIQNSWKCKSSDVAFNVDLINIFFTNFENNTD